MHSKSFIYTKTTILYVPIVSVYTAMEIYFKSSISYDVHAMEPSPYEEETKLQVCFEMIRKYNVTFIIHDIQTKVHAIIYVSLLYIFS